MAPDGPCGPHGAPRGRHEASGAASWLPGQAARSGMPREAYEDRVLRVADFLRPPGGELWCLGTNKDGLPQAPALHQGPHPLESDVISYPLKGPYDSSERPPILPAIGRLRYGLIDMPDRISGIPPDCPGAYQQVPEAALPQDPPLP